jgi:hypothetical protein
MPAAFCGRFKWQRTRLERKAALLKQPQLNSCVALASGFADLAAHPQGAEVEPGDGQHRDAYGEAEAAVREREVRRVVRDHQVDHQRDDGEKRAAKNAAKPVAVAISMV